MMPVGLRSLAALVAAVAALAGGAARAAEEPADALAEIEVEAFEACVRAAGAERDRVALCEGRLAAICRSRRADGDTTQGMVDCDARELGVWEGLLAGATEARADALGPEAEEASEAAATAWRDWRAAECRLRALKYSGGSLARVEASGCMLALTVDRYAAVAAEVEEAGER